MLNISRVADVLKKDFQKFWLPRGVGPTTQVSGKELMFSIYDAPWMRFKTAAGLLPVRLRSIEINPSAASWAIRDRETDRVVIARLDGDDLRMVLHNAKLLGEAFDACLAIHSGINAQKVG